MNLDLDVAYRSVDVKRFVEYQRTDPNRNIAQTFATEYLHAFMEYNSVKAVSTRLNELAAQLRRKRFSFQKRVDDIFLGYFRLTRNENVMAFLNGVRESYDMRVLQPLDIVVERDKSSRIQRTDQIFAR